MIVTANAADVVVTVDHVRAIARAMEATSPAPVIEDDFVAVAPSHWFEIRNKRIPVSSYDFFYDAAVPRDPGSAKVEYKPRRAPPPGRVAARRAARKARRITRAHRK